MTMDPRIQVCNETARGCGYRKENGLYLRCDGIGEPCGRLPLVLTVCPCCGEGIRPARGWTWIDPSLLVGNEPPCPSEDCSTCPLSGHVEKVGLLWIGERFYATPEVWLSEARSMGVSRRISALPRGFVLGETWVLVAHRKVRVSDVECRAIFHAFKPTRIEKVVKESATTEEIDALVHRGISPVVVNRIGEQAEIASDLDDELTRAEMVPRADMEATA